MTSKLNLAHKRSLQKLKLIQQGFKDLVKDAHHNWRPRIDKSKPKSYRRK